MFFHHAKIAIASQGFDGASIMQFKVEDLTDIKVPKGSALSIFNKIDELKIRQRQNGLLQDSVVVQLPSAATTTTTPISPARVNPSSSNPSSKPQTPQSSPSPTDKPPSYSDDEDEGFEGNGNVNGRYGEILKNPNQKTQEEEEDDREFVKDLDNRTPQSANLNNTSSVQSYLPTASKSSSASVQSFNQVPEAPLWNINEFSQNQRESKYMFQIRV